MKLVVFGVGYVGLVTGAGLSELGHEVLCVDVDAKRVQSLHAGKVPFYEPGLSEVVQRNVRSGRLHFATDVDGAFRGSDIYFIAVGTPPMPDGSADLRAVREVAAKIRAVATAPAIVAVKSTVPVGTCDHIQTLLEGTPVLEVVSNPEFLKEGSALQDFFRPDRIIIGANTDHAADRVRALYAPIQLSGERVIVADRRSSELIKYASNTMLAMRVSFMNELSRLCHATGADIHAVRAGMGSDQRIGRRFIYAGPGYGGSCFPKDVQALIALGKDHGLKLRLAEATHAANLDQTQFVVDLLEEAVGGLRDKNIAFWGLTFKPETDDVREAPALRLAERLLAAGASVVGHDPEGGENFKAAIGQRVRVVDRELDALDGAQALLLLTEWRSYRAPDFAQIRARMRPAAPGARPVLLDARNVWRAEEVQANDLRYVGIGVRAPSPAAAPPRAARGA